MANARMPGYGWVIVAPLVTQTIISIGKWGAYPSDSVREWYPNIVVYLISRLAPPALILYGLGRGQRLAERRWLARAVDGPFAMASALAVFVASLIVELGLSVVEWYAYPRDFTRGWYSGAFYLFEGTWILPWICVYWGASALVVLVERLTASEASPQEIVESRTNRNEIKPRARP